MDEHYFRVKISAIQLQRKVNLEPQTTKCKECCTEQCVWYKVEIEALLTAHKLIFCLNSFSPSNITLISSWRKKKKFKLKIKLRGTTIRNFTVLCNHSPWCCLRLCNLALGGRSWRRWRWWPESRSGASQTDRGPLSYPAKAFICCVIVYSGPLDGGTALLCRP